MAELAALAASQCHHAARRPRAAGVGAAVLLAEPGVGDRGDVARELARRSPAGARRASCAASSPSRATLRSRSTTSACAVNSCWRRSPSRSIRRWTNRSGARVERARATWRWSLRKPRIRSRAAGVDLRRLGRGGERGDHVELAPARDLHAARDVDRAQLDRRPRERAHDGAGVARVDEQPQPGEDVLDLGALEAAPRRRAGCRARRARRARRRSPGPPGAPSARGRRRRPARRRRAAAARPRRPRPAPARARSSSARSARAPPAGAAAGAASRSGLAATTACAASSSSCGAAVRALEPQRRRARAARRRCRCRFFDARRARAHGSPGRDRRRRSGRGARASAPARAAGARRRGPGRRRRARAGSAPRRARARAGARAARARSARGRRRRARPARAASGRGRA